MKVFSLIKFALLLFVFSIFVAGQETKEVAKQKQVLLNVSVFNYKSEIVKNLKRENFLLYENNKSVEISYFNDQSSPISVGFLIDVSQSMRGRTDLYREGILTFLEKSGLKNEYFVAAFSGEVKLLSDFTDANETSRVISASPYFSQRQKRGETVLSDAVNFGIERLSKSKNRKKVLLILWDNDDKYPSGSYKKLEELVREKDITIYPVHSDSSYNILPTTNFDLEKLAEISGGKPIRYEAGEVIRYRSKLY